MIGSDRNAGARQLFVTRLRLQGFRCHRSLSLDTGPETVVLTGRNGVGKTSILEALSLLSPGRGLRRARLEELASSPPTAEAKSWAVAARLETPLRTVDIGTGTGDGDAAIERRQLRIDGRPARSQTALAEILNVLWLTPEMDRLFLEGAGSRRRFLDRLIFGLDPGHASRVGAYERALQQRSRVLREQRWDSVWLAALEGQMAAEGVAISAARVEMAGRLTEAADAARPFPGAQVTIEGPVERWLATAPALAVEERFGEALAGSRATDAEGGGAAIGPHRADVVVRHRVSGRLARESSTGEQKALLIALVLATARLQQEARGTGPLLLLDEVAAHLDAWHRDALFDALEALDAQAWYAGTDCAVFAPLAHRAQFITVGEPAMAAAVRAVVE